MISSDVGDLASEQLARRLQEEEDQRAAYQLQHQFNRRPIRLGRVPTHALNILPGPSTSAGPAQFYVPSDEEDDDVRELSFVQLSDDDQSDRVIPMSPETNQIVSDALNTAFTTPDASRPGPAMQADDEVVILDDSVVEDHRPGRQNAQLSSNNSSDNLVLTVGRSTRSQTRASPISSSIVITNNSQAPSANTRSRTRNNQNRARNSNSRSPNNRANSTSVSGSSDAQTVHISDNRSQASQSSVRNRTATQNNNNRQQSSSSNSSNNANTASDSQPTTSTGRRGNRSRNFHFSRGRGRRGGSQVSSRVILNGIPITDYQNGMPAFLNGVPLPLIYYMEI